MWLVRHGIRYVTGIDGVLVAWKGGRLNGNVVDA
jgi:hypothetical protein